MPFNFRFTIARISSAFRPDRDSQVPIVPIALPDHDTPASALAALESSWKAGRNTPFGVTSIFDQVFDGRTTGPLDLWQPKPGLNIQFKHPDGVAFGLLGNNDDNAVGTNANDYLYGGAGKDFIHGNGGKDFITGDFGDDRLFGGAGDDFIWGGQGRDKLYGGSGDDWLFGGADNGDAMYGGSGNDTASFSDITSLGLIVADLNTSRAIVKHQGIDKIQYLNGIENLFGSMSNDALTGNDGDNVLTAGGGSGIDQLFGRGGNDKLVLDGTSGSADGGAGDDIIDLRGISSGGNVVRGGEGFDQLLLFGTEADWKIEATGDTVSSDDGETSYDVYQLSLYVGTQPIELIKMNSIERVQFADGSYLDF